MLLKKTLNTSGEKALLGGEAGRGGLGSVKNSINIH